MPGSDPSNPVSAAGIDRIPKSVISVQQDLRRLAAEATAVHELLSGSLRRLAEFFRSPYIAVTAQLGAGSLDDRWHQGKSDPEFWRPLVDRHLTETFSSGQASCRLLGPADRVSRVGLIGAGLRDEYGTCFGAISLVLARCDQQSAGQRLATLEALTGYLSLCVGLLRGGGGNRPAEVGGRVEDVVSTLRARQKPQEVAFAITNRLRNKTGCDQVALGIPAGHRIQIVSVSGMDEVHPRSPGIKQMRSAMEECYDSGGIIACPGSDVWAKSSGGGGYRLHWQWSQATGSDSVASFALEDGEECVAIVSLRRKADRPLVDGEVEEIKRSVSHLGTALRLSRLANRRLLKHAVDSVREASKWFFQRSSRKWQVLAAGLGALMGWMAFGTMEYNLIVPSTLQARSAQILTAPFDGVLVEQAAVAGDTVRAGQTLFRLDDRELLLEKQGLEAQINTIEKQKDEALALGERAKVQVLGAMQEEVRANLRLVQWRLDRSQIVSPIDAVVLAGDLREKVGSPVRAGQVLFEIAPPANVYVELAVPEEEVDEVSDAMAGAFAANAVPEALHRFEISLVRPVAEVRDQRTVFVCEGTLSAEPSWFRPGMEGMARVSVGHRPVWWVVLHRMIDFVRMKAWF